MLPESSLTGIVPDGLRPVPLETWHAIAQFLYCEARTLDAAALRTWLERFLSPDIRYRVSAHEERFSRDVSPPSRTRLRYYEDDYRALDLRVRQFETGLQRMLDPQQKIRRVVTNIEAYSDADGCLHAYSLVTVTRTRRLYEHETTLFFRKDMIQAGDDMKLLSREVELDQRVVTAKNLLFFV